MYLCFIKKKARPRSINKTFIIAQVHTNMRVCLIKKEKKSPTYYACVSIIILLISHSIFIHLMYMYVKKDDDNEKGSTLS
jgi:hypothetical protein